MQSFSAFAAFCEDIREEKSGQDTLVGIYPDNLTLAPAPSAVPMAGAPMIPKLGLYLRVHFDSASTPPKNVSINLVQTDGQLTPLQAWSDETIQRAFSDARAQGIPITGLILKIVASPVFVHRPGRMLVKLNVDGSDYIAGALNIIFQDMVPSAVPTAAQL